MIGKKSQIKQTYRANWWFHWVLIRLSESWKFLMILQYGIVERCANDSCTVVTHEYYKLRWVYTHTHTFIIWMTHANRSSSRDWIKKIAKIVVLPSMWQIPTEYVYTIDKRIRYKVLTFDISNLSWDQTLRWLLSPWLNGDFVDNNYYYFDSIGL